MPGRLTRGEITVLGKKKNTELLENKKQFKSPNAYIVIYFIIVIVAIMTWIIPGGSYQLDTVGRSVAGTYTRSVSHPQGVWDILLAPILGMVGSNTVSGAIIISLNIMIFGAFLEMMDRSGAIKIALRGIAFKYQENYHVLITTLVFLMGAFGTIQGAYEEGYVYLMMFLPVIIAMGLDTMVAVMIVVLGTQGGCLASIVNPFSTGIASGIAGISPGEGMLFRSIIFFVVLSFISFYVCHYADKVKKNPSTSPQFFRRDKDQAEFVGSEHDDQNEDLMMSREQKRVLGIFIATFIIMIISLIPWSSLNEDWTFFEDFTMWIAKTPVLGTILGKDITPLGSWYFNEINVLLIVATFVAGKTMHFDIDKSIGIFTKGAGALVSTAFIVPLARGIQVIMDDGMITPTILHFGEGTLSVLHPIVFVIICLVFYSILASFIPSSTGLAAATMSIMAPLAIFAGVSEAVMVDIYNMALGMAKMIMPTSIVVMTCTAAVHIGYGTWVKTNLTYMIGLFLLCCVFLVVLVLI